jgi:hypothetical protein
MPPKQKGLYVEVQVPIRVYMGSGPLPKKKIWVVAMSKIANVVKLAWYMYE